MGTDRSKIWLYKIDDDFIYHSKHLDNISFSNEWITIDDGALTIEKEYAWDGATPKWQPLDLFTFGAPDGAIYLGKRITHDATLVHDALTQWKESVPITKKQTVDIFDDMLGEVGFKMRPLYVWAVNKLGPKEEDFGGYIKP